MDSKIKNNELPDGWGEVELGQIVDFVLGQAPSSKSYNEKGEGTLFVRAGDFGDLYPNPSSYTTEPISFG
jgi:type I restriction enzyme S subunit